ncbi:MAG: RsmD family RNA methyltransferase [Robiginitalea sp.]
MRIISGIHKGRRIRAPKGLPVRPTTDRAKESLFNILGHQILWEEWAVLDLFAGTGNISYECASRGCPHVVAVDSHAGCVRFIRKTADELQLPVSTHRQEVLKFLKKCAEQYDLIFADPPYDIPEATLRELVSHCLERGLLKKGGVLVIEHSPQRDLSGQEGFSEMRSYGSTRFSFFRENK